MLERDSGPTKHFGFLISAELEEGRITPEQVVLRLCDALSWVEGVGTVEAESLGTIEVYDEKDTNELQPK